jgi:RimJ/RimL family protein N-acetyltransferase
MSAPPPAVMETARLWLREMTPADAGLLKMLNDDPQVLQYTGDMAFASEEEARQFLEGYEQYRLFNRGRWAVIRKEDNAFMGWCGLKYHPDTGQTDLGFRLMKRYWNHGYTTEAARACLAYGFDQLGLAEIYAQVRQENTASVKVLKKLGLRLVGPALFDGIHPGYLFSVTRDAWISLP